MTKMTPPPADLSGAAIYELPVPERLKNLPRTPHMDAMESYAKDYVDQKFETERARTDARFIELSGKMDAISTKIDALPSRWSLWMAVITTGIAIVGIVLAAVAFGGAQFSSGVSLADQRQEQLQRDQAQSERIDQLLKIVEGMEAAARTPEQ